MGWWVSQTSYHVTPTWVEVGLDWIELKLGWMLVWVVTINQSDANWFGIMYINFSELSYYRISLFMLILYQVQDD